MYRLKAKSGWHIIDSKKTYTDSLMEAEIISELVSHGFSQKWRRSSRGISFGSARYTPDVELSINREDHSMRAVVEFKAFEINEFSVKDRKRMLVAMRYYAQSIPLLYIRKTKQWYEVLPNAEVTEILPPLPGLLNISQLSRPRMLIPVSAPYGHSYNAHPTPFVLNKVADGLEFGIRLIFGSKKTYQRTRKRR